MKYTVHLYYAVRIRMEDIEADSQEEAVAKAADECDVEQSLAYGAFEDADSARLGALVDEEGADEDGYDYARTRYHEGPGAQNYLAIDGAVTKHD